jgi:cytochrome c
MPDFSAVHRTDAASRPRLSPIFAAILAASLAVPASAPGQSLDLSITDPDEIGAICGGDRSIGERLFAENCVKCHELAQDAPASVGPNLFGLFGRKVAAQSGFDYSAALLAKGAEGMIWERETLSPYLSDPSGFAPGTTMNFPGIKDAETLQHLMTYLRVASHPPPPAPGAVEVPQAVLDLQGDPAFGEYLASECVTCHRLDGADQGIPKITGWPKKAFLTAMYEYRLRARPHQAMQLVAERLTDEELAALAAYFGDLQ